MPLPDELQPELHLRPTDSPAEGQDPPTSGFRLIDLLVDPRGLQTLMLAGGGLLALGLVLWLAAIGVFAEPLNAAIGLGVANLSLLGTGVWLAAKTRYRLAGRGTAMLACLVMPLNLWFYNAQGLVTLTEGGHLWVAALACCVLYAVVARLLRDSLFVYAFVAGVSMTGLLFLADGDIGRFWEVLAPSTLLVSLGVACIHAERLFPVSNPDAVDRTFTRDDFGLAFFRAGHTLLVSGLVVLLAGRLLGRFHETVHQLYGWIELPDVATQQPVKLAALALTLVGTYAYGYSRITERRGQRYTLFAVLTLAWSAVIGIDLIGVDVTEVLIVALLGVFAIVCRLAGGMLPTTSVETTNGGRDRWLSFASHAASVSGLVALLVQLVRCVWLDEAYFGPLNFSLTWSYLLAATIILIAEVLASRARAANGADTAKAWVGPGLAVMALAGGLGSLLATSTAAPMIAMTTVLLVGCGATLIRPTANVRTLIRGAIEPGAWFAAVMLAPYALFEPSLATIAVTLGLAATFAVVGREGQRYTSLVALLFVLATGYQAAAVYELGVHLPLLALSAASVVALAVDRWSSREGLAVTGRVGLLLAATAGGLLAGNRILAGEADGVLLAMIVGQTVLTAAATMLTKPTGNRGASISLGVVQGLVTGLVLNEVSVLTFGQRAEVFTTLVGVGLVVAGLVAWRREVHDGNTESDYLTDTNLWIGSLLATVPLTLGLIAIRFNGGNAAWVMLHEIGVLTIGLSLVGVGTLCRLRATTLTGGGALAVYLASLLMLLSIPAQLQNVAVYLIVGGAMLFGSAVLLSVYRDRLLAIPEQVRDGEGVFAVLKWR